MWGLGIEPVILNAEPFSSPPWAFTLKENTFPLWQATDVAQAGFDLQLFQLHLPCADFSACSTFQCESDAGVLKVLTLCSVPSTVLAEKATF